MSEDLPERSGRTTFWEWFWIGALLGLVYSLFRNPGAVACCGGCLVIAAVLAAVLLFSLMLQNPWFSLAVVVVAIAFFASRRNRRD